MRCKTCEELLAACELAVTRYTKEAKVLLSEVSDEDFSRRAEMAHKFVIAARLVDDELARHRENVHSVPKPATLIVPG